MQRKPITKKYMNAWEALYSAKGHDGRVDTGKARTAAAKAVPRSEVPSEQMEQVRFVRLVKQMGLPIMAIPNGARRSLRDGAAQKAGGLMAGAPDIFIPVPKGRYSGCFIEMKRTKYGVVSQLQKECIAMLNGYGYLAQVACGCDEAMEILRKYLNESTPKIL